MPNLKFHYCLLYLTTAKFSCKSYPAWKQLCKYPPYLQWQSLKVDLWRVAQDSYIPTSMGEKLCFVNCMQCTVNWHSRLLVYNCSPISLLICISICFVPRLADFQNSKHTGYIFWTKHEILKSSATSAAVGFSAPAPGGTRFLLFLQMSKWSRDGL